MAKEKTAKNKYKVMQEHEKCIGCGACVAACPDNWVMSKNNKAKPKKTEISEAEYKCNKNAADVCPISIIHIKEIK